MVARPPPRGLARRRRRAAEYAAAVSRRLAVPPSPSSSSSPDVPVPLRVEHVAERQGACHGVPRDALSARRVISLSLLRLRTIARSHTRACTPETSDQPAAARTFPLCLVPDLVQNGE